MDRPDWQVGRTPLECTKYMLENEVSCDVCFKVGEDQETIKAHKLILSMRSPVFNRMFSGSFCESTQDPVIPDVSGYTFRSLLRYCYYECIDIEVNSAILVIYAAKKYILPFLEEAAKKIAIKNLHHSNVWDICKYVCDVGDEMLQEGCTTYFKKNLNASNIVDVVKYAVIVGDRELQACCQEYVTRYLNRLNIWDIYEYAVTTEDQQIHDHCKLYFQRGVQAVREALEGVKFLNITHKVLLDFLHINDAVENMLNLREDLSDIKEKVDYKNNPGISISDIELFKASNAWAFEECLRKEIDPNSTNKRAVLGKCLYLIRFPTMLPKDLANVVYPTGMLTPDEIVQLCQSKHKDPGTNCQIHFPISERQFMAEAPYSTFASSKKTSYLHIDVVERVVLSRVWLIIGGSFEVTVRNLSSQRAWSSMLDTQCKGNLISSSDYSLHYLDIEPQLLESGINYSVTVRKTAPSTFPGIGEGVKFIKIRALAPIEEVKFGAFSFGGGFIYAVTLSFV